MKIFSQNTNYGKNVVCIDLYVWFDFQRKRLAEAEYHPPDLADATVVGRKKRRKQREVNYTTSINIELLLITNNFLK